MTAHSHADLIGRYIKLRNFIDAESKAFKEKMKPYDDAMTTIENHMTAELIKQSGNDGKASIATPQGTCFRKLTTSVKMADREQFMDFVFDGRREGFLTNHVSKDAVTEYLEQFKSIPPGIDIATFYTVQFNSPKGT